jgi:hypothetical protein
MFIHLPGGVLAAEDPFLPVTRRSQIAGNR